MFQTYHLHRIENIRLSYSTNQVLQCLHNRPQFSQQCQKCVFFWSFIKWILAVIEDSTQLCFDLIEVRTRVGGCGYPHVCACIRIHPRGQH